MRRGLKLLHKLPWGHNLVLLDKLGTEQERRWYASKAIELFLDNSVCRKCRHTESTVQLLTDNSAYRIFNCVGRHGLTQRSVDQCLIATATRLCAIPTQHVRVEGDVDFLLFEYRAKSRLSFRWRHFFARNFPGSSSYSLGRISCASTFVISLPKFCLFAFICFPH